MTDTSKYNFMKLFLTILALSIASQLSAQKKDVNTIIAELKNVNSNNVLVVAHRGDWRNAPENSLLAIRNAIDQGVDIIEIDVQRTRDGHLIIMHDQTVDRTTDGKGYVKDMPLDSVRKLHLRNGLGRITRHMVPTLEEAMLAVKGKAMVNLDKCYDFMNEAYAVLMKTGTVNHALFKGTASATEIRKAYGSILNKVFYIGIVDLDKPDALTTLNELQRQIKPIAFELIFSQDTVKVFKALKTVRANGARLWINSLWASLNAGHDDDLAETDEVNSYGWIVRQGATVIQTDRPVELIQYLNKHGLRSQSPVAKERKGY